MPIDKTASNKELLEACYKGDEAAINLFYDRYKDLVYSTIHKWMSRYARGENRKEGVEEVFQQAFLELMENGFRKLKQARDQDKPAALIFLITYQCAGRHFKAKWKEQKGKATVGDPEQPGAGTRGVIDRKLINRLIEDFLATLNSTEQNIFELRFAEGMKYEAIARQTGLTTDNVGVTILRLKEKFKAFAREKCPGIENML